MEDIENYTHLEYGGLERYLSHLSNLKYLYIGGHRLKVDLPQLLDNCKKIKKVLIHGSCNITTQRVISKNSNDEADDSNRRTIVCLYMDYTNIDTNALSYLMQQVRVKKMLTILPAFSWIGIKATVTAETRYQLENTRHKFKEYCDKREDGSTDISLKQGRRSLIHGYGAVFDEEDEELEI